MSQLVECPRCRRRAERNPKAPGRGQGRCPTCGTELVLAAGPNEDEVLRYLYRQAAP